MDLWSSDEDTYHAACDSSQHGVGCRPHLTTSILNRPHQADVCESSALGLTGELTTSSLGHSLSLMFLLSEPVLPHSLEVRWEGAVLRPSGHIRCGLHNPNCI